MADLAALADGSLAPERRAEVEAKVAASPELRELLARQRRALRAITALPDEPAPDRLAAVVTAAAQARRRPRRRPLALAATAAAAAAVVIVVALLTLSSGPASPSLADAARLAALPPSSPPPATLDAGHTTLAASVQGVAFPDLATTFGWQASGLRHGSLRGRPATVVYYESKGARIAYVIVAGPALPRPGPAAVSSVDGVEYRSLSLGGRPAVTWREGGHTCLLTGDVPAAQLLELAAWSSAYAGLS